MGFMDFIRSVGSGINKGLQATKIASTLAPVLLPGPAGAVAGRGLAALGYRDGGLIGGKTGRALRPMKKGGKVKKAPKAKKAKKPKRK
jgi:hypothetical protein